MDTAEDHYVANIAPNVLDSVRGSRIFESLDDLMSPADPKIQSRPCQHDYSMLMHALNCAGYSDEDREDVVLVLQSLGGCCDCEILYNVAEDSRLKSRYWKTKASNP
jgi:hypothetical protein